MKRRERDALLLQWQEWIHAQREVPVIKKRVLLGDDAELLEAVEGSFFARNGFSLLVAGDAGQAYEMIEEKDPALAVLPLEMSGGGDICCRRVKADPVLRPMSIILVADGDDSSAAERCVAAGCDGTVSRPIDSRRLLALACELLGIAERGAPRERVCLDLRCGIDPDQMAPVEALDINSGGIFVATDELAPVDTTVTLAFVVPGGPAPLCCRGRVAWVNHPEWIKSSGRPPGMGIEFIDMPAGAVAELLSEIDEEEGD